MIEFLPVGGADEIGANCYYLYINGTGIILDCGIHPRKTGRDALPDFALLKDLPIDFCLISHSHQDHIGALPFLLRIYPHIKIFATPQSIAIMRVTLHNAVNILQEQIGETENIKFYTHDEIELFLKLVYEIKYNEPVQIEGLRNERNSKINLTFTDAGHILGSASIIIEHDDIRIFYTGDINLSNQMLMKKADLPVKPPDIVIMESTYGNTDSKLISTWPKELNRLVQFSNRILNSGGSILIPVFALGKTQEILASLFVQMEKGILTQTEIYTAGIGRDISRIYDDNKYLVKRNHKNLNLKEIPQQNLFEVKNYDNFRKSPSIILASSGMLIKGTMSYKLACYWLNHKKFAIAVVGYVDPESTGFVIANSRKGDIIRLPHLSHPVEVKCEVERFYFPSHSKREELVGIIDHLRPAKVILVHGDEPAKDWIGHRILSENPDIKVVSSQLGKKHIIKI